MPIETVGIDLGKDTMHVVALDGDARARLSTYELST